MTQHITRQQNDAGTSRELAVEISVQVVEVDAQTAACCTVAS